MRFVLLYVAVGYAIGTTVGIDRRPEGTILLLRLYLLETILIAGLWGILETLETL